MSFRPAHFPITIFSPVDQSGSMRQDAVTDEKPAFQTRRRLREPMPALALELSRGESLQVLYFERQTRQAT